VKENVPTTGMSEVSVIDIPGMPLLRRKTAVVRIAVAM
jgi:hypothetical protein